MTHMYKVTHWCPACGHVMASRIINHHTPPEVIKCDRCEIAWSVTIDHDAWIANYEDTSGLRPLASEILL